MNLGESRRCVIENVESFLEDVNDCLTIREYLCEFPFTAGRIKMEIVFMKKGYLFESPHIASVQAREGFIFYYQYNPLKNQRERVHSESYAKALGIVQHQKNVENIEAVFGPLEDCRLIP